MVCRRRELKINVGRGKVKKCVSIKKKPIVCEAAFKVQIPERESTYLAEHEMGPKVICRVNGAKVMGTSRYLRKWRGLTVKV